MYCTQIFTRTFYFLRNFGYSSFVLWRKAHSQWLFLRVRVWAPAACWEAAWVVATSKGTRECFCSHVFLSLMLHHSLSPLRWWVQNTFWPWHHTTENRLMRQRKWGSLFCRQAGSNHLVVVKTDHTELFCFVRAEFHSLLLDVYLISCKNCCPFLVPLDLLLLWNAKSPTLTLQQNQFTSSNKSCDFDYIELSLKGSKVKQTRKCLSDLQQCIEKQKEMDGRDKENKTATIF